MKHSDCRWSPLVSDLTQASLNPAWMKAAWVYTHNREANLKPMCFQGLTWKHSIHPSPTHAPINSIIHLSIHPLTNSCRHHALPPPTNVSVHWLFAPCRFSICPTTGWRIGTSLESWQTCHSWETFYLWATHWKTNTAVTVTGGTKSQDDCPN